MRRGPKRKLRADERYTIIEIDRAGQPIEPLRTKQKFNAQCGVLVRDMIPISIEQWLKPKDKDSQVSYVSDRQKADLWTALQENFTFPPEEDPENPVKKPMIKAYALKKMAELLRRWKNELKSSFDDQDKTPEFIGRFEKINDQWPTFVTKKKI